MSAITYIGGDDGTAKKVQKIYIGDYKRAKSFLINSDFNGESGWNLATSYYTFSFIEDYLQVKATVVATDGTSYRNNQNLSTRITGSTADTAQKIYCCARVRGYSTNTGYPSVYYSSYDNGNTSYTSHGFYNTETNTVANIDLNDDQWHVVGRLFTTYDSSTGDYSELYRAAFSVRPYLENIAVGDYVDIKELCFFNLTEIYGRGNEPTQEWCFANIIPDGDSAALLNLPNIAQQVKKVYIGGDDGTAKLAYAWATANDLIDFEYTANNDGTYTLTDWNGTKNGVSGTEIIIPDGQNIIL